MKTIKLTFNKREVDFSLGIGFLGELLENYGVSVDDIDKKIKDNPFKWFPIFLYESAKFYAESEGDEFNYTLFDYIDMVEDDGGINSRNLIKFYEGLLKSLTDNVPVNNEVVKEPKKK